MDHLEPARPTPLPGPPAPRERDRLEPARPGKPCEQELKEANAENARLRKELEAKNAENAQLKERIAALERQLEAARPHLGPPAGPLLPYSRKGIFRKGIFKRPEDERFSP